MYTLYHNLASTCSQKVRWTFAEKDIEFESKEIDLIAGEQHEDWYCAINPKRVVPSVTHEGGVILESSQINLYLEDVKPEPRLLPNTPSAYSSNCWRTGKRCCNRRRGLLVMTSALQTAPRFPTYCGCIT